MSLAQILISAFEKKGVDASGGVNPRSAIHNNVKFYQYSFLLTIIGLMPYHPKAYQIRKFVIYSDVHVHV